MSKNILSATLIAAAAALSFSAQADNSAWLEAKQPALSTSAKSEAPTSTDRPASGSIAAWKQAKFPAVDGQRVAAAETVAAHPRAGTQAGWKQAKFPHLQKTGR
jgi:hypothetical protein